MNVKISEEWQRILQSEFDKPYFEELTAFVKSEYASRTIYPRGSNIFRAFDKCMPSQLKVVIIGQDPYHGEGQANGLAFSVNDGIAIPPSLRNIFTEIHNEIGTEIPASGNLDRWADQGVLLLNAVLTVRAHEAASHAGKGWEAFTDAVVDVINRTTEHTVFMLWGNYAQRKGAIVDPVRHCVLKSPHPSPFSASNGFFGCGHFAKANQYLAEHGKRPVVW